jgi:hypothetical protein
MVVKVSKPEINVREKISELDKPSGTAGQAMLAAETPQEQQELIGVGRRNIIINGAMRVNQRNLGIVSVTTTPYYIVDRFSCYNAIGSMNAQQSTDTPAGFAHSFKVECTTANASPGAGEAWIQYKPEAQDMYHLAYGTSNPKSMTISFWVKSTVTGLAGFYIYQADGARAYQARYTVHNSNTWEWKSITIPGDAAGNFDDNNDTGAEMRWYLAGKAGDDNINEWGTNPTYTSDRTPSTHNFNSAVGNVFAVTGVQLEVGKVATPFEHRSYGEELALCHRYYQKYGGGAPYHIFFVAGTYNSNTGSGYMELTGRMRAVPTVSSNGNFDGGNGYAQDVSLSNTFGMLEPDGTCKIIQLRVNGTGNNYLTGGFIRVRASNDTTARIIFDAEL